MHEEYGSSSKHFKRLLDTNVGVVEADEKRRLHNLDTRRRADAAMEAIEKKAAGQRNGYGHMTDRDFMLRLEAAVAIIVNGAPAHLLPSYPHDSNTTHNVTPA